MAVRDDRSDVKQTTRGFRGPLMVQSLTSAKSKFLSLADLKALNEKRLVIIGQHVAEYGYGPNETVYNLFHGSSGIHPDSHYVSLTLPTFDFSARFFETVSRRSVVIFNSAFSFVHPNAVNALEHCWKGNIPVIFYWHDGAWILEQIEKSQPENLYRLLQMLHRIPIAHWVVSTVVQDVIKSRLKVNADSIYVVGNTFTSHPGSIMHVRRPPEKPLKVVGVGTLAGESLYRKGGDLFCEICSALSLSAPSNYQFSWFGAEENSPLSAGISVPRNCNFYGFKSNWMDTLTDTDVFLLTSRDEPFGIAAMQALSFDIPVFCFDNVGACDFVPRNCHLNSVDGFVAALKDYRSGKLSFPDGTFRKISERYEKNAMYRRLTRQDYVMSTVQMSLSSENYPKKNPRYLRALKNRIAWRIGAMRGLQKKTK